MSSLASGNHQQSQEDNPTSENILRRQTVFKFFVALLSVSVVIGGINLAVKLSAVFWPVKKVPIVKESGLARPLSKSYFAPYYPYPYSQFKEFDNVSDFAAKLRAFDIWNISQNSSVPAVVVSKFPEDLGEIDVSFKKKLFFNSLLPAALVVGAEIDLEKKNLYELSNKIQFSFGPIPLKTESEPMQTLLNADERNFLNYLTGKYRTEDLGKLLTRVDKIPVSLLLAQGAIESSWGSARFTREGNNLFGVWTWGNDGLVPFEREPGKNHKVASYNSLLDSVRAYCLTLNRVEAYRDFRLIRRETKESLQLADGLLKYSERGQDYVEDLKSIIRVNKLKRYDNCSLLDPEEEEHILQ